MRIITPFDQFGINESSLELNKASMKAGKVKKEFSKFPCVMELPGYDLDGDGIIEVFGMDTQYFSDGTYRVSNGRTGKFTCENGVVLHDGKPVKGSAIKVKGPQQKFVP